jgi:hydrogenase nickel incorporation protein HypB
MNTTPRPPRLPRLIEVRRTVLKQNDLLARALRERFREAGVFVVSIVSSPGSGKTALLEKTLAQFRCECRVAALVGDLATGNDKSQMKNEKRFP